VADLRQASADVGSFLVETLLGMKLVVGANAQAREIERFRRRNDGFVSALMRMQLASYVTGGVPGLIVSLGSLLVFLYGGGRVIDGTLTLGTFVAFIAYQMRVLGPVQGLMGLYASLATVQVSLARVREIVGADPEVVERADATPLPACRGAIGMDEVSFTFGRGTPTLDRVSFRVEAGERVAIVGPSGAGKSTIADLLRRLLDPDQGSVRLDGHDLRDLRLADVRQHVVLVDQDPFLFHATLAENIRYARPDASTDAVDRAARLAGLGPFIDRSAGGADTMVGERGTALSAGERQRVAIARALLAEPAVLVLDEATAALDPATEDEVRRGYEAAMGRRTTVLITHRPHLARRADRILVFDGASLVEQGTPDELEARRGRFTALFQSEGAAAPAGRAEDRG